MAVILIIAILIGVLLLLILAIKHHLFIKNLLWNFQHCNVLVAGKKGTGKDLLFQYVINKRGEVHYGNISYGDNTREIQLKEVSCEPNDYNRIVNNNIEKQEHTIKEGADIYISDIGVFLPSYMDSKLYQKFPSMPIFYALSRHLYANNVHCNTQNIERGWKALREQADFYCITKRTIKLPFFLITKVYTYDNYNSAF